MEYSKIKRYYFTVCAILFVLLFILMLIRSHGALTPEAVMSTLVGWIVLCALIIGVVYMFVMKHKRSEEGKDDTAPRQ